MKEKKKIYAVIDTNVLVSSLLSSNGLSNPAIIIKCISRANEDYQKVFKQTMKILF